MKKLLSILKPKSRLDYVFILLLILNYAHDYFVKFVGIFGFPGKETSRRIYSLLISHIALNDRFISAKTGDGPNLGGVVLLMLVPLLYTLFLNVMALILDKMFKKVNYKLVIASTLVVWVSLSVLTPVSIAIRDNRGRNEEEQIQSISKEIEVDVSNCRTTVQSFGNIEQVRCKVKVSNVPKDQSEVGSRYDIEFSIEGFEYPNRFSDSYLTSAILDKTSPTSLEGEMIFRMKYISSKPLVIQDFRLITPDINVYSASLHIPLEW